MRRIAWIGLLWMGMGLWLCYRGMRLLQAAVAAPEQAPCIQWLGGWGGFQAGLLTLLALSLGIGFLKGRFVLRRAAVRLVSQWHAGARQFYRMLMVRTGPIVLLMMGLGMALRFSGIPKDLHGAIDLAIGCALAQGGLAFVRALIEGRGAPEQSR
jgi:hypothetical protein